MVLWLFFHHFSVKMEWDDAINQSLESTHNNYVLLLRADLLLPTVATTL